MGFHLALVSLQVPLETDGEGHVQDIQVPFTAALLPFAFFLCPDLSLTPEHLSATLPNYFLTQS